MRSTAGSWGFGRRAYKWFQRGLWTSEKLAFQTPTPTGVRFLELSLLSALRDMNLVLPSKRLSGNDDSGSRRQFVLGSSEPKLRAGSTSSVFSEMNGVPELDDCSHGGPPQTKNPSGGSSELSGWVTGFETTSKRSQIALIKVSYARPFGVKRRAFFSALRSRL